VQWCVGLLKKLQKSCFTTLRNGLATNVVSIIFKLKLWSFSACIVCMFFLACPQHINGFVHFTQRGSKLSSGTTCVVCHSHLYNITTLKFSIIVYWTLLYCHVYVPVCNLHFCLPPWFLDSIWYKGRGVGANQNSLRWVTEIYTTLYYTTTLGCTIWV
jgi:hypothetical protein